MACKICDDRIDAIGKVRIVTLIDGFGSKHNIQIQLLVEPDPAAVIASEIAAMNQRETAFVEKLKSMNYGDDQIDALRKDPNDCGCTGGAS